MKKAKAVFLISILFLCSAQSYAQTYQAFMKAGNEAFEDEDYFSAQTYYSRALEFDAQDPEANYKLAESYFNTTDLSNAAIYYKRTLELEQSDMYSKAAYQLALIQMKRGDYENALAQLETYLPKAAEEHKGDVEQNIANCEFAIKAIRSPMPIKTENLGEKINSPYSDFAAQLFGEDLLYYSSLRFLGKFEKMPDDSRISKILVTEYSSGKWKNPKELNNSINRPNSHNCNSAITADNQLMVFTRCNYNESGKLICSIYESKNVNGKWSTPKRLPSVINKRILYKHSPISSQLMVRQDTNYIS